eukprot:jgi/Picsp_1/5155/NSC_02518-R1_2-c-methyl-d-erythritol 4-phosphate cytidylyltransferase
MKALNFQDAACASVFPSIARRMRIGSTRTFQNIGKSVMCFRQDLPVARCLTSVRQIQTTGKRLPVFCSAAVRSTEIPEDSVSIVLLAGGVGKRMGASIPKQYLEIRGKPIATYSMETFSTMPCVGEIVVVCEPEWRPVFESCYDKLERKVPLKYASPGAERQDSVLSGLQKVRDGADLVAIHDSARPLIKASDVLACVVDAKRVGAAVLGVPVKPTIKEAGSDGMVVRTLKRSVLWEVQTPQVIEPKLLQEGFQLVQKENLEVTDDVSIIEAMNKPVIITRGCYTNIKVTTPEDMAVAEGFLDNRTT